MKVLVTGANGFIGRYVCEQLERDGHTALKLDKRAVDGEAVVGDVRDAADMRRCVSFCDAVIHLAGVLGTQECIQDPRPAVETNILGGINMLEAVAEHKVPAVFCGIGNHWMNNTYSITKSTIERFVSMYNRERGTRINVVRPVNVYGPRQVAPAPYGPSRVRKVVPSFVCRALCGDDIEIYGDGKHYSDLVYVEDAAKVFCEALYYPGQLGTIELGPEDHTSVIELAETINALCGRQSKIVHLPMRPGEDPDNVIANTAVLNRLVYWDFVPLSQGLKRTIAYFGDRILSRRHSA